MNTVRDYRSCRLKPYCEAFCYKGLRGRDFFGITGSIVSDGVTTTSGVSISRGSTGVFVFLKVRTWVAKGGGTISSADLEAVTWRSAAEFFDALPNLGNMGSTNMRRCERRITRIWCMAALKCRQDCSAINGTTYAGPAWLHFKAAMHHILVILRSATSHIR